MRHTERDSQDRKRRRLDHGNSQPPAIESQPATSPLIYKYVTPPWQQHNTHLYLPTTHEEISSACACSPTTAVEDIDEDECLAVDGAANLSICCFGMVSHIPVKVKGQSSSDSRNLPVVFQSPNLLRSEIADKSVVFEIESHEVSTVLEALGSAEEIESQLYCYTEQSQYFLAGLSRQQKRKTKQTWFLNVIIYGPVVLEEIIGEFLSSPQLYLQDPLGCDRNVPYRNPHLLPPETDEIIMTSPAEVSLGNLEIERLEVGPDLLARLMENQEPLPETDAPPGVITSLFSHQKEALTFLLRRESGWAMDRNDRDVWTKQMDSYGRIRYLNTVNGSCQDQPPPKFQGGLLADDMGLGKTLSMICLIVANQAHLSIPSPPDTPLPGGIFHPPIKTTLLIVPLSLIQTWENQFHLHLKLGLLQCHVYHGQNRNEVNSLANYDVVITTYQTVSSIWRKIQRSPTESSESIFSVIWHRIILDEAHTIQTQGSYLAQACCALHADRRWAVTGTPIQNKLSDFASIVKYLQVYPYCNDTAFQGEISRTWQRGDPQGFFRLKTLVRSITLSRTKAVVCLPSRVDEVHHLDFSLEERREYESAKAQTVSMLDEAISAGSKQRSRFNALSRLNILRLICSHGLLARNIQAAPISSIDVGAAMELDYDDAQEPSSDMSLGIIMNCSNCGINISDDLWTTFPDDIADFVQSQYLLCGACSCNIEMTGKDNTCFGRSATFQNFNTGVSPVSSTPTTLYEDTVDLQSMSTKVKALVADLREHYYNEKCVVFSFWTYTLDLIERMLKEYGILYTRIDGGTSRPKRSSTMEAFQKDDTVRVILVSITCGGAGLDLTAASRVYLMEPHWNPMIEEQALCRVHRVGQRRSVTTIRYLMRDSFEEQVVEIQKRKKLLVKVAFGQESLSEAGIDMGDLRYLRGILE